MSFEAIQGVLQLRAGLRHAAFRVLMVLADHADELGQNTYPAVSTIAKEAETDAKTVRRCQAHLVEKGLIRKEAGGGRNRTNRWTLTFPIPTRKKKVAAEPAHQDDSAAPLKGGVTPSFEVGEIPPIRPQKGGMAPVKEGMTPSKPVQNLEERREEEGATPAVPTPPVPRSNSGSRLAEEWEPSAGQVAFALSLSLDAEAVADQFRDHWHSEPDPRGRKADWAAAWRVWCRRDARDEARRPRAKMSLSEQMQRACGLWPAPAGAVPQSWGGEMLQ